MFEIFLAVGDRQGVVIITSKNVVKYDPLKRIFLRRFSYVRTEIYANLRSYSASIILTYKHAKFHHI